MSNSGDLFGTPRHRLTHPSPRVRAIALRDLAASGDHAAIIAALQQGDLGTDESTLVLAARLLSGVASPEAMAALARVRDDPSTPPRAFHAALLAHDTIEQALRRA
ncbi:MAG: hypothetical protein KF859_05825 [Phycisphaeraceae bacterium]|nr:hypothetical protein [Phycisphaeraceae bacterium]